MFLQTKKQKKEEEERLGGGRRRRGGGGGTGGSRQRASSDCSSSSTLLHQDVRPPSPPNASTTPTPIISTSAGDDRLKMVVMRDDQVYATNTHHHHHHHSSSTPTTTIQNHSSSSTSSPSSSSTSSHDHNRDSSSPNSHSTSSNSPSGRTSNSPFSPCSSDSYDHHHHHRRERRMGGSGVRWVLTVGQLWVCVLWVLLATPANTCADSNGCDFYGSGLEQDGRGVQPVYLSCSSGRLEWQYPRAGLRVILTSPHKGREFHACIRGDASFQGARIYLEGHRSLLPIFALDDGRPRDLIRCFSSYKGQAALYVEAEPGADDLKKQVASFEYDLQTLPKGVTYDPAQECRPCTEEELLHLYCSGDFVVRGSILKVRDYPRLAHTTLTLKASKIFQQTSPVFRHSHTKRTEDQAKTKDGATKRTTDGAATRTEEPLEEDDEEVHSNLVLPEGGYVGRVEVPLHCGAQAGQGEFMVMGVMRLGHAVLRCAPRQEEWRALALQAQNRAQCVLET